MMEKIMKAVKSSNKKRGKNITIGAVVGMLLSCASVMGADEFLWIRENGGKIEFNTAIITNGAEGNWKDTDPYSNENEWSENTYINNITLSGKNNGENNFGSSVSYGLRLSGELGGIEFINNGSISGEGSNGYGVYNYSDSSVKSIIENLTNSGSIHGDNYGIFNHNFNSSSTLEKNMKNLTNKGKISSEKYGIQNFSSSPSSTSGTSGIENLTNSGSIYGGSIYDDNSGIYNLSDDGTFLKIDNLINNGIIYSRSASGSSYGIYNNKRFNGAKSTIVNLTNTGVIYGKTNAIKNESIISNPINYGILASSDASGNVVDNSKLTIVASTADASENQIKNFGLAFTATDSGYKNNGNSDANHNFGSVHSDENIDGVAYTIRNITATVANSDGAITEVKSFGIKDGKLYKDIAYDTTDASSLVTEITGASTSNVILNGIENTLKVVGNSEENSISNGTINAYGTAIEFVGTSGGSLALTGAKVNGGIKDPDAVNENDRTYAIKGSSGADTLKLENTVINGNIDMKAGANTIEAGSNTTVNGNITTEGGDDTFTTGNNTAINGNIDLGAGENKIELGDKVYINGNITTGTGNDTFILGNNVAIGAITTGAGDDELTIGAGSIINGTLDGGAGTDTLTFGTNSKTKSVLNTEDNINISHDITGFENINVGTRVTFASDLTISDATEINIGTDGVLVLTVNKNVVDNSSGTDKIIGHTLYNLGSTTSILSTGGRLLLDLDGANGTEIITFGNTKLEDSIVPGDKETLDLTSKVHTIEAGANTNVMVVVLRWSIPEILKYKGLNGVYHGIGSVNDLIGNFNIKSDEQLVTFIEYLNNIYAGSPYSYSSELSRKSMGMFRDIVVDNIFKPETNKWMIYGGLTHIDGGTKDTYYGKGYYTYDIGSSDMDADTKITGAYMLGEYGISDTLTSGVVIGGNKLKSDLSNDSKVDGSALYLGAYAKKYIGNLKVTAGAGFQYGDYDADRMAVNKVASSTGESMVKYSDNYNDMTYDIYLNGRYSNPIGDNLFLEPYGTLSYTYIKQDGADEGNKALAIETDSKSFDYTVGKIGVDLKKVIPHEKGKSTLSAGVSYTRILNGADEECITGKFKGESAKNFDILVAHKNEHSIGLNAKYALELENGVIFDMKGTYSVERDSHNNSGKNKTKGEWIVGAGLGYKF